MNSSTQKVTRLLVKQYFSASIIADSPPLVEFGDCTLHLPTKDAAIAGAAVQYLLTKFDDFVNLQQLQDIIRNTYDAKDRRRGVEGTFMWFMEEVGELSAALRSGTDAERAAEFADVLAWLATLANIAGVDLEAAVQEKYGQGCPGCHRSPCMCDQAEKP